ncbi:MAG: ABC transporter permease [Planctomycetota bacterium]
MRSPQQPAWLGLGTVALQELQSSLRDRQTVLNAVVLPIVLYPVLFWLIVQGFLVVQGHKERTAVQVWLAGAAEQLAQVEPKLVEGTDLPTEYIAKGPMELDEHELRALLMPPTGAAPDPDRPEAVLVLPPDSDSDSALYIASTRSDSELAASRVQSDLTDLQQTLRQEAAAARGLSGEDLVPLRIENHTVTTSRDQGAFVLSLFLPMMIVFMSVMGAFFPAVDSTAGEKERGTAETTLLIPIPRSRVLLGKILATTTLAFLATLLNLISMGLAARHLLMTLGPSVPIDIQFPFLALLYSLPLILLFCFFVSAVLTALAGLTKSFKEGQAMLGPAQLVFILPAVIGVMPGLELTPLTALIPVVNVVLAVRAILIMQWLPLAYAITAGVLLAAAWIAVRLCVRLLSLEALAFAGTSMSLKDLFLRSRHANS